MSLHAIGNAESHYETISAYWELAEFFSCLTADAEEFADLSSDAKELLDDVCGITSHDELCSDTAEQLESAARDDVLSVCVRSSWTPLGDDLEASEFELLLSTDGPACRIVGELRDGEPCRAEIQWQDCGTPWTRLPGQQCDALNWFASLFYFG